MEHNVASVIPCSLTHCSLAFPSFFVSRRQNLGAACQQELDANSSRAFVNGARGAGHESFRPNAQIDGWAGEHSAFQFPVDKNAEMRRSYMEDSSALKDLIQQGTSTPEIAREFGDQEHIAKMYPLFDGDRLVNVEVNVSLADQIIPTKDVTDSSTPQTRLFDVHRSVVQVLLKSCSEPVGLAGVFASFHKNHTMLCYAIDHRIASNIENVRPSLQLFCTRVYTPEELMEEVGRHFAWSEVAKGPLHELELQMWLLHRFPQRSKKRVVCSFQDLQKQQLSWLKYHDSDLPDRVFVCLHERLSSSTVLKNVKNNDESLCGHATLHIIYDHDDVVVPVAGNLKVLRELVADKPIPFVMLRIILSRQKLIDIKFQSIHFILQGTEESFEALKNEIATNEELRAYNFRLLPYTPEKDEGAAQGAAEPEAHALDAKSPSFFGDEFAKSLPVHEEEEEGEEVEEDPPTPLEPSFVDEVAALLRRVVSQSAPPVPKLVLVFSHEVEYTKHVFLSSFADASEGALVHVELRCARISGLSPSGHRFDVLLCNAKDRSLVLAAAQGMPIDLVVHDTRACEPVDVGQCSLQIMPPLSGKPKVVDDVTKALAELRTERGEELFGAFREIVRTIMEKKTGSSVEDLAFELEKARLSAHPEPIPLLDAAIAQGDVDKEGGTYSLSEKMQKSLSRARLRDDDWENPPRLTCTVSQVFDVKADSWKEVESPSVLPRPKPDGRGFQHIRPLESAVQVSITTKRSPLNRTVFSVLAVETILRFIE